MRKNELTDAKLSAFLDTIYSVHDIDTAIKLIKQLDAMKVALESMEAFREKSVLFARLEAETLIRVCALGGMSKLRGNHRKAAEWLFSMKQEDRDRYIAMCEDGLTIDNVYKREFGNDQKISKTIESLMEKRAWVVEDVLEQGIVDISSYAEEVRFSGLPRSMANDIIDGTRNALRRAGAVGVGDDSRIYVMPNSSSDGVKSAILMRYKSIVTDLNRVKEIHDASGCTIDYRDLEGNITNVARSYGYLLGAIYSLVDIGVIANTDDMFDAIAKSDIKAELKHDQKILGNYCDSRKKILETLLNETNRLLGDMEVQHASI